MSSTQSLRELFETAVDLAAPERLVFLDRQCPPERRAQVERLLAADSGAKPLFAGGAAAVAAAIGDARVSLPPGSLVGSFELLGVLGDGGSSTVFRARRDLAGVSQEVALKVLHRGVYTPDVQRQFRREREVLSQLRHPGIARLIDGGVTGDGVAYIALELVAGTPIVEYARERRLDLRERLTLFLQVCAAVESAHRALIVHRDLKPSNVFVAHADGQVKLLDFGIAKLLDRDDDTRTGLPAFTPAYAAPEQREGGLITTATDVYALGVLLGELVTGQRLSGGSGRTPSAQITGEEAPGVLPAPPPVTRRALVGDLDNIVLKAIEREPDRRYASAGALADDIRRMLDGLPVAAHPPSRLYRTRKFVQRHRGAVAASVLMLLGLGAAFGLTLWQAKVAREAQSHAERDAARANATRDFLISVFRASDPRVAQDKPRGQVTAKELLDVNAPRIDAEFADDPATHIALLGVVASVYRELGDNERFAALHKRQLDLARQVDGETSPLLIEAAIDESQTAVRRSDYAAAQKSLASVDATITAAGLDRSALRAYWWLSRALTLHGDDAKREERKAALQRAAALYAEFAPQKSGYVETLYTLGTDKANDPATAEDYYRQAIARMDLVTERDDSALVVIYGALASAQQAQANYAGAEASFAKMAELAKQTVGEHHPRYWIEAAKHARMVHRLGDRGRAQQMYADLLTLLSATPNEEEAVAIADVRQYYAECLNAEGRPLAALPLLSAAAAQRRAVKSTGYGLRLTRAELGESYDRLGRRSEAEPELRESMQEWMQHYPKDSYFVLQARERWARFLLDDGNTSAAETEFRSVLDDGAQRHFTPIALAHGGLARLALQRGDAEAARAYVDMAIDAFDHATGNRDVRVGPYLWLIRSQIALRQGDRTAAHESAQRALDASVRYDDAQAASIRDARAALEASKS